MDEEEDKSQKNDEQDHQISRVSLKVTSECVNLQNRNTLKVTSSIQINKSHPSAKEIDINLEGAGTSKAITVLYNKNSFFCDSADSMFTEGELIGNECIVLNLSENDPITQQILNQSRIGESKVASTNSIRTVISTSSKAESTVAEEHPVECEVYITPPDLPPSVLYTAPPLVGGPPTYSAVMRLGPTEIVARRSIRIFGRRPEVRIQPSPPFVAPAPPPSYAEAQGLCVTQPRPIIPNSTLDLQDSVWGPDPLSVICTYCNNFIITTVHSRRSNLTHFSALALCICGCWPCCLLPYCLKACKSTYHECPVCRNTIGVFNPW